MRHVVTVTLALSAIIGCSAVNTMEFDDGSVRHTSNGTPSVTFGMAMAPNFGWFMRDSTRTLNPTYDPIVYVAARQAIGRSFEVGAHAWWTSIVPLFPVLIAQQGDGGVGATVKYAVSFPNGMSTFENGTTVAAIKIFGSVYGVVRALSNNGYERANGYTLDYGPTVIISHDFRTAFSEKPEHDGLWRSVAVVYVGAKMHVMKNNYEYGLDADSAGPARQVASIVNTQVAFNPFAGVSLFHKSLMIEVSALFAKNPWTNVNNIGVYVGVAGNMN